MKHILVTRNMESYQADQAEKVKCDERIVFGTSVHARAIIKQQKREILCEFDFINACIENLASVNLVY